MNLRTLFIFFLATIFFNSALHSQDEEPILLSNPSFEDMPRPGKPPRNWFDCGFPGETPPDVQPDPTFSVSKPPQDGYAYLGMVVRDNDTWESVSQRLSQPLEKGKCYEFSIFLAQSELYISVSRTSEAEANYTTPAKLRIYGGFGHCDKQYMLAETRLINNKNWLEFKFKFEPIDDYTYLILEAFYKTPTLFPYNGNILVDNASPITLIPCDEEVDPEPIADEPIAIAEPEPEEEIERTPEPPKPVVEDTAEGDPVDPIAEDPIVEDAPDRVVIPGLTREELKKGKRIQIDKLFFEADSSIIKTNSYPALDEVYRFLATNSDVSVEIGGHTNGLPPDDYCDRLSEDRAKAVADYLATKGINRDRLQYKGYGKREPIASNKTVIGRRRNQRVEIKILNFNG